MTNDGVSDEEASFYCGKIINVMPSTFKEDGAAH